MKTFIYDLDGTVVDSSHRYKANEDGTVDIAHWRQHSTRQHIMKDQLMPLAQHWKNAVKAGHLVIVCTARVLKSADVEFLRKNGLFAHLILSRDGEADPRPAFIQKEQQIKAAVPNLQNAVMFEDCPKIRQHLQTTLNLTCIDPEDV